MYPNTSDRRNSYSSVIKPTVVLIIVSTRARVCVCDGVIPLNNNKYDLWSSSIDYVNAHSKILCMRVIISLPWCDTISSTDLVLDRRGRNTQTHYNNVVYKLCDVIIFFVLFFRAKTKILLILHLVYSFWSANITYSTNFALMKCGLRNSYINTGKSLRILYKSKKKLCIVHRMRLQRRTQIWKILSRRNTMHY